MTRRIVPSLVWPLSALLALGLVACGGSAEPSASASPAATAAPAQPETAAPATGAETAAAPSAQPATTASAPPADATAEEPAKEADYGGATGTERYTSGFQKLETPYDLSSLSVGEDAAGDAGEPSSEHGAGDGHDHDGDGVPDHADPAVVQGPNARPGEAQPGAGLIEAQTRYLGGISLVKGESKSHDFGMIREGESREKVFHFVSDGEEPLVIKAIKPSCGCTRADVMIVQDDGTEVTYERGSEIPKGSKFNLYTEVSTEGKHGVFGTSVSLYTNAPGGSFNIKLEAAVEPVLEVLPQPSLFFGQMTTADVVDETLTVRSHRGEPFLLSCKEETVPEELSVELTPVEPGDDGRASEWKVRVVAGPGLPVGVRNYPCALVSDIEVPNPNYPNPDGSPKTYTVAINVQARVTGMVAATPQFVGFGLVSPGQMVERSVRLECFDEEFQLQADTPVEIAGLYGGEFEYADDFTVTTEVLEDGRILDLRLTLDGLPDDVSGSFGGVLKIDVGYPNMQQVDVRFSGVCRATMPGRGGN